MCGAFTCVPTPPRLPVIVHQNESTIVACGGGGGRERKKNKQNKKCRKIKKPYGRESIRRRAPRANTIICQRPKHPPPPRRPLLSLFLHLVSRRPLLHLRPSHRPPPVSRCVLFISQKYKNLLSATTAFTAPNQLGSGVPCD